MANTQSVSAPESPSQPQSRTFRNHTYLGTYSEHDLFSERGMSKCTQNRFEPSLGEIEHDYDEVTHDDVSGNVCHNNMSLRLKSTFMAKPQELSGEIDNSTISTPDSVVKESESDNEEEIFDPIHPSNEEGENIYDHVVALAEFENPTQTHESNTVQYESNISLKHCMFDEHSKVQSPSSSVVVLPHLNSEDRLNNNNSLDTLLAQSILVNQSQCSINENNESITEIGNIAYFYIQILSFQY